MSPVLKSDREHVDTGTYQLDLLAHLPVYNPNFVAVCVQHFCVMLCHSHPASWNSTQRHAHSTLHAERRRRSKVDCQFSSMTPWRASGTSPASQ